MQDKTINNITSNPQATHNQVAVNSMAMAVLKLRDDFLDGSDDPDRDFNEAYDDCTKFLRALTVDDFFKKGETRDPKLVKEITNDLTAVIKSIIDKTNQKLDPNFDQQRIMQQCTNCR